MIPGFIVRSALGRIAWRALGNSFDALAGALIVEAAAEAGYENALAMCGNDGQVSVIEMTGFDAFLAAAEAIAAEQGDPSQILRAACPYPEAVGQILDESAGVMEEIISDGFESGDDPDVEVED